MVARDFSRGQTAPRRARNFFPYLGFCLEGSYSHYSSGLRHSADPQKGPERSTIVKVIYWPSAHPATVPGWWVRGLLSVRWDLVVGISGASWNKF